MRRRQFGDCDECSLRPSAYWRLQPSRFCFQHDPTLKLGIPSSRRGGHGQAEQHSLPPLFFLLVLDEGWRAWSLTIPNHVFKGLYDAMLIAEAGGGLTIDDLIHFEDVTGYGGAFIYDQRITGGGKRAEQFHL